MIRLLATAALVACVALGSAEEPKKDKPKDKLTVDLSGDIKDEILQRAAPASGVIATQEEWEKLAKVWEIKDAPKVDFKKELLIVGVWRGSTFSITPVVKDGDLTVSAKGTKDLVPGFRWKVMSIKRDGIKSVTGQKLP